MENSPALQFDTDLSGSPDLIGGPCVLSWVCGGAAFGRAESSRTFGRSAIEANEAVDLQRSGVGAHRHSTVCVHVVDQPWSQFRAFGLIRQVPARSGRTLDGPKQNSHGRRILQLDYICGSASWNSVSESMAAAKSPINSNTRAASSRATGFGDGAPGGVSTE